MQTGRIQSLESLRFILALLVMQSHLRIADWSFLYFYNGNLAVIFFFMLSGFGLAYKSAKCHENSDYEKWSFIKEYKYVFTKMNTIYFWYILFILISLPWQFWDLLAWHNMSYAIAGTLATIVITPTMLQSIFGFYQASHLGLGAYWFISTLFILKLIYPLLHRLHVKVRKTKPFLWGSIGVFFGVSLLAWRGFHFISQNTMLNDLDYGSPFNCVFYFVIGMLLSDLYILYKNGDKDLTIYEVLISVCFTIWCLGRNSFLYFNDMWQHMVDVGICMALLGIFAFSRGGVSRKVLQSKLLLKLSEYSMYVYLGHYALDRFIGGTLEMVSGLTEIQMHILEKILVLGLLPILCCYMRKCDVRRAAKKRGSL